MEDVPAKVTNRGQVTVPKAIRDALGLAGQDVVFRVLGPRVVFAADEGDLDIDFEPPPPPTPQPVAPRIPWDAARRSTLHQRAKARRRTPTRLTRDPAIVVDLRSSVSAPASATQDAPTN